MGLDESRQNLIDYLKSLKHPELLGQTLSTQEAEEVADAIEVLVREVISESKNDAHRGQDGKTGGPSYPHDAGSIPAGERSPPETEVKS